MAQITSSTKATTDMGQTSSDDTTYIRGEFKAPRVSGIFLRLFVAVLESRIGGMLRSKIFYDCGFQWFREQAGRYADFEERELPLHYSVVDDNDVEGERKETIAVDDAKVMKQIEDCWKAGCVDDESEAEGGREWRTGVGKYVDGYNKGIFDAEGVVEEILKNCGDGMKDGILNAIVNVEKGISRKDAKSSSERRTHGTGRGILEGVPIVVKESLNVEGFSSSSGSGLRVGICGIEKHDAKCVAAMKKAGCVVAGKTNMDEIGAGVQGYNKSFGQCRNPWNVDRVPGGSTGGGAAAVAAGLAPVAIGTDGGGSVRIPAACCGLFGLKPTFGRLSTHGDPLTEEGHVDPVKHIGPLATNAADMALAYHVMAAFAGHKELEKICPTFKAPKFNVPERIEPNVRGIKIGIYKPWNDHADKAIVDATSKAITKMTEVGGATIVPITIRHLEAARVAHAVSILFEFLYSLQQGGASRPGDTNYSRIGLDIRAKVTIGRILTSEDYALSRRIRCAAMLELDTIFKQVDIIITPALGIVPPVCPKNIKTGVSDIGATSALMRFVVLANFTGIPAVVFPVAFDEISKTPIGVQAMAKAWNEDVLLKVSAFADRHLKPNKRRPQVFCDTLERLLSGGDRKGKEKTSARK